MQMSSLDVFQMSMKAVLDPGAQILVEAKDKGKGFLNLILDSHTCMRVSLI